MTMPEGCAECVQPFEEGSFEIGKGNLWIGPSSKAILQQN